MGNRNTSNDQHKFLVIRNLDRNYCFDFAFQLIMSSMKTRFMNHYKINGIFCADTGRLGRAQHRLEEGCVSRFEQFNKQH